MSPMFQTPKRFDQLSSLLQYFDRATVRKWMNHNWGKKARNIYCRPYRESKPNSVGSRHRQGVRLFRSVTLKMLMILLMIPMNNTVLKLPVLLQLINLKNLTAASTARKMSRKNLNLVCVKPVEQYRNYNPRISAKLFIQCHTEGQTLSYNESLKLIAESEHLTPQDLLLSAPFDAWISPKFLIHKILKISL